MPSDGELIDLVAAALRGDDQWDSLSESQKAVWRADAERAIKALRSAARTGPDVAGQVWTALKEVCAASPDKSEVKKLVLVSEEDVRAAITALPAAALAQPEAVEPVAVLNGIRDALEERGYFHMANGRDIGSLLDATPPLAPDERMRDRKSAA